MKALGKLCGVGGQDPRADAAYAPQQLYLVSQTGDFEKAPVPAGFNAECEKFHVLLTRPRLAEARRAVLEVGSDGLSFRAMPDGARIFCFPLDELVGWKHSIEDRFFQFNWATERATHASRMVLVSTTEGEAISIAIRASADAASHAIAEAVAGHRAGEEGEEEGGAGGAGGDEESALACCADGGAGPCDLARSRSQRSRGASGFLTRRDSWAARMRYMIEQSGSFASPSGGSGDAEFNAGGVLPFRAVLMRPEGSGPTEGLPVALEVGDDGVAVRELESGELLRSLSLESILAWKHVGDALHLTWLPERRESEDEEPRTVVFATTEAEAICDALRLSAEVKVDNVDARARERLSRTA